MSWNQQKIDSYHKFAGEYISGYKEKVDCADLALASLVEFAGKNRLLVRLKYYKSGWKWYVYNPEKDNANAFKNMAMTMLGALNIIDNTKKIKISEANPGDLIMTKWSPSLGHTRIIYSVQLDEKKKDYRVVWYQGNLPPVVPEKKESYYSEIGYIFENAPRRWRFEQFDG